MQGLALNRSFRHSHHSRKRSDGLHYWQDYAAALPPHHIAQFTLPFPNPSNSTSLTLDFQTDQGKRACQQLMTDMAYFWLGQPVQYMAYYVRDW